MSDHPECDELFKPGTRHHIICRGDALDLPLYRTNDYRRSYGLPELEDDGRERSARVIHNGKTRRPRQQTTKSKTQATKPGGCGGCGSGPAPNLVQTVTAGPGTELSYIFARYGALSCPACKALAARMDAAGPDGCERDMKDIIDDIYPRAREWLRAKRGGRLIPEKAIRMIIKRSVNRAIENSLKEPEWKSMDHSELLAQTEIIVKSFKRPQSLLKFVKSVSQHYPTLPVRIVDDSGTLPYEDMLVQMEIKALPNVSWHDSLYDTGLAAGRNLAVAASPASYVILCDDDYEFTEHTKIEAMLVGLIACELDICGGLVRMDRKVPQNWSGRLAFQGKGKNKRWLVMTPAPEVFERYNGVRIQRCDITYNFFAARREFLMAHPWDERFKINNEHIDSFTTWWQAGARTGFTVDCFCDHQDRNETPEYKALRSRNLAAAFLQKWGIVERKTISTTEFHGLV